MDGFSRWWLQIAVGVLVASTWACTHTATPPDASAAGSATATISPSTSPTPLGSAGPFGLGFNIIVRPDRGPVGTRVHLEGGGFTGEYWREVARTHGGGYGVFLIGPGSTKGCELIAGGPFSLRINPSGVLIADFTVTRLGSCFQMQRDERVRPGRYAIGVGCHACEVAYFRVTSE